MWCFERFSNPHPTLPQLFPQHLRKISSHKFKSPFSILWGWQGKKNQIHSSKWQTYLGVKWTMNECIYLCRYISYWNKPFQPCLSRGQENPAVVTTRRFLSGRFLAEVHEQEVKLWKPQRDPPETPHPRTHIFKSVPLVFWVLLQKTVFLKDASS